MSRLGLLVLWLAAVLLACVAKTEEDDDGGGGNGGTSSNTGGSGPTTTVGGSGPGSGAGPTTTSSSTGGSGGAGGSSGCVNHWDCPNDQVCIASQCDLAYGRTFRFTVLNASVATTDPNTGEAWDALGGAPDGLVNVYLAGSVVATTATVSDSFTPTWNEYSDFVLQNDASEIGFELADYDPADENDPILFYYGAPYFWLEVVRSPTDQGLGVGALDGSSLSIYIEPL